MKVYLSGRMSGLPEREWRMRFKRVEWRLWWQNVDVDINMVGDDWQQSRGARLERLKAREWGIKELK